MSAHDALQMIDAKVESLREGPDPILGKQAVIDILTIIRNGLTRDPEWSDIQESNLRAELARAREEALHTQLATDVATSLFQTSIAHLRRQLESARRIAVALEQEIGALPRSGVELLDGNDELGEDGVQLLDLSLDRGVARLVDGFGFFEGGVESLGDGHAGSVPEARP